MNAEVQKNDLLVSYTLNETVLAVAISFYMQQSTHEANGGGSQSNIVQTKWSIKWL